MKKSSGDKPVPAAMWAAMTALPELLPTVLSGLRNTDTIGKRGPRIRHAAKKQVEAFDKLDGYWLIVDPGV
jgi:hypothetical protein